MQPSRTVAASWLWSFPVAVFVVTFVGALNAARLVKSSIDAAAHARVEAVASAAASRLLERLENAGSVARGIAALFGTTGPVSEDTFEAFVEAHHLSESFVEGRVAWVERDGEGSLVVRFIFPGSAQNDRMIGAVFPAGNLVRETIEQARDEGRPVLIRHYQHPGSLDAPRFGLVVPAYSGSPTTLEERRAAFKGAATMGAERAVLMNRTLAGFIDAFDLSVEDAQGLVLWRSPGFPTGEMTRPGSTRAVSFGGEPLTVRVAPRADTDPPIEGFAVRAVLVVGVLLAFSFAALTFQQLRGRRAAELAGQVTTDALQEAERRRALLALVVEQSSDGIIMADAQGALRLVNRAAATLYGVEPEAFTPSMLDDTPLRRALVGELVPESRWTVSQPGGEKRQLSGTAVLLKNPDGTTPGALMVMRDETVRLNADVERESLILALEYSNADLEQFASVASHDLKAPLRGISQLAQWLEEDLAGKLTPDNAQHLSLLKGRVKRLVALIEGILAYARAGQSSQTLESFEAKDAVLEAIAMLAPPPGVVVRAPEQSVLVNGDRTLLLQVLMNLLSNAFKHGRQEGGVVEVRVQNEGAWVRFAVGDNGPGIAAEYHTRIWGMFQTLHPRDEKESTGIGLAVVRKVVHRQGGRTWLESSPGQGATFLFTWPRRPLTQKDSVRS